MRTAKNTRICTGIGASVPCLSFFALIYSHCKSVSGRCPKCLPSGTSLS